MSNGGEADDTPAARESGPIPTVSVIIPVFDDFTGLDRCVAALLNQQYSLDEIEVIVVDNGPVTGAADRQARLTRSVSGLPNAQVLHQPQPGSYSARNLGLDTAKAEILAFTDADCVPAPEWLSAGVRHLNDHPETHAVAGSIKVFAQDDKRRTGTELYELRHAFQQRTYVEVAGFGATANLFARRAAFEAVGQFDSSLRSGGDREWGRRLRANGLHMAYEPAAVVRHPARHSFTELRGKAKRLVEGDAMLRQRSGWRAINWMRYSLQPIRPPVRTIWRSRKDPEIRSGREFARYSATFVAIRWMTALYRMRSLRDWAATPRR